MKILFKSSMYQHTKWIISIKMSLSPILLAIKMIIIKILKILKLNNQIFQFKLNN